MSTGFEFNADARNTLGKAKARRMRLDNRVPAVIYGGGEEPQAISLPHDAIFHALKHEAVYSHILDVKLNTGKTEKVVLKDVQRHVFKPKIMHVDFLRVKATEKLIMHVPLHFVGEELCAGVVNDEGVLSKFMTDVEIKCLPAHLPEFIEIDITQLQIDHTLHISDIPLPAHVEFAHELDEQHNRAIVGVHKSRAAKEEDTEAPQQPAAETDSEKQPDA